MNKPVWIVFFASFCLAACEPKGVPEQPKTEVGFTATEPVAFGSRRARSAEAVTGDVVIAPAKA